MSEVKVDYTDQEKMRGDDNYWAAQPRPVQALRAMPVGSSRTDLALALATQGYIIDYAIMVNNANALGEMAERQLDGLPWVNNAMQPNLGFDISANEAPFNPYNPLSPPPLGAIVVKLPDYAPPPPPPPAPVETLYVGSQVQFTDKWAGTMLANSAVQAGTLRHGDAVSDRRGATFFANVFHGPFGAVLFFTKTPPA